MATKRKVDAGSVAQQLPPKRTGSPLKLRPREPSDTTQLATWNLMSLDSEKEKKHGYPLRKYIEAEQAHIVVLTETHQTPSKLPFDQDPEFNFLKNMYKYRYWQGKIAILSNYSPLKVIYGLPNGTKYDRLEAEDRIICLEFENTFILGTYVPNSGTNFSHIHLRKAWNEDFIPYLRSLDARKPVIWTELMNPRRPGPKFVDVWRLIHPEAREYTHFTKKTFSWRLDGFIVSQRLLWRVRMCEIRHEVKEKLLSPPHHATPASDHWPCWLSLEMEEGEM